MRWNTVRLNSASLALMAVMSLLGIALAPVGAPHANAQSLSFQPQIYRVQGVSTQAQAQTATVARGEAIAIGQTKAFDLLVERLTLPEQRYALPPTAPEIAASFVTALEVPVEETTPTRWIGVINVTFDPAGVRNYLRGQGIIPIESMSRAGVVLPLVNNGDGTYRLWDPTNDWFFAWQDRNLVDEQSPIIAPLGDATDREAITAREANELNRASLSLFAARYGVERVYVARAFVNPGTGMVSAQLQEVDFAAEDTTPLDRARASGRDFADARDALAKMFGDRWKTEMLVTDPREAEVAVTVRFDDHLGWLEIRDIIGQSGLIVRPSVQAVMRDGATMSWRYLGQPYQLQKELNERGATLSLDENGAWQAQTIARQMRLAAYEDNPAYGPTPPADYDPYGGNAPSNPLGGFTPETEQ